MKIYTELVALDIGTSSIKLVSVDDGPAKQGYIIRHLSSSELPQGLVGGDFTNPFISDMPLFKSILAEMLKKLKNRRQGFIIGLPDRWVKMHLQTLELTESELKSPGFLTWRLEKTFPAPEGMKTIVDYQILETSKDAPAGSFRVLAAAVKKDIIEILSGITTDLQIEVMAFDTSSLGIFNLYEETFPERTLDRTVIHLHVGHETTVVKVYSHNVLIYERVIEVAGEEFAKIISEIDSVNLEKAMKNKESEKFFPVSRDDINILLKKRARIERIFGNWLRELNVTFRFFQDKFNVAKIPPVFMTGGSCMFEGLPGFVSEYFETECQIFNPLEELPVAQKIDEKQLRTGPLYAAGFGLIAR